MSFRSFFSAELLSVIISIFLLSLGGCELTEPNLSFDECLAGKAPCPEICNGKDDDEDGSIDEGLNDTCIVFTTLNLERTELESGFGQSIVTVPDLNDDGRGELLVATSRSIDELDPDDPQESEVSLVDGLSLQIIRTVRFGGDFGHSLVVGKFDGMQNLWCAGAPTKEGPDGVLGKVLCLDFEGNVIDSLGANSEYGLGQWLAVKPGVDKDQLVISEPLWQRPSTDDEELLADVGRIQIVSLDTDGFNILQTIVGGESGQKIGQRVIAIKDGNGDGIDDYLLTGYSDSNSDQRQVWLVSGEETLKISRIKRFSAPENTDGLFGEALAIGRFDHRSDQRILAFGAPVVEVEHDGQVDILSRVYFTTNEGEPLGTSSARVFEEESKGIGSTMAKVSFDTHDILATAGPGRLRFLKLNDAKAEVITEFDLPRGATPILAATKEADDDGTFKVWIGLPELNSVRLITVRPPATDPQTDLQK